MALILLNKAANLWINNIIKREIDIQKLLMDFVRLLTTSDSTSVHLIPGCVSIFFCWSIFCLFMTNFYSSDLVSFLTIPRYTPRIDTADEFVKFNLSWQLSDPTRDFPFLDFSLESHRFIRDKFSPEDNPVVGAENIRSGKYASLVYKIDKQIISMNGRNDTPIQNLRLMKSCLISPFVAYGFRHNSPFKVAIDKKLRTIFESGIVTHISEREIRKRYSSVWESVMQELDYNDSNEPEVLRVEHIFGAFILLFIGYLVSFVAFINENKNRHMF